MRRLDLVKAILYVVIPLRPFVSALLVGRLDPSRVCSEAKYSYRVFIPIVCQAKDIVIETSRDIVSRPSLEEEKMCPRKGPSCNRVRCFTSRGVYRGHRTDHGGQHPCALLALAVFDSLLEHNIMPTLCVKSYHVDR